MRKCYSKKKKMVEVFRGGGGGAFALWISSVLLSDA